MPEEEGEVLPDVGGANLGLGSPEKLLQARRSELSKMERFEVYTPVLESSVPQGSYWTTLRWVDVRKSTNELKSRLVAREFKGAAGGEERDDVFAATPVPASLRMLLLKVANDPMYVLRTADVTSAFLHAGLQGPPVYTRPPEEWKAPAGFKGPAVWKIERSLYGLRNSPRSWQDHLCSLLSSFGFRRGRSDGSVFFCGETGVTLVVHVDDLAVAGPSRRGRRPSSAPC